MTNPDVQAMTIDEAAAKWGKSNKTVRRWIVEKKVIANKVGDRWYIDVDAAHPMSTHVSTQDPQVVHDVQAEMAAEIRDLHDEIATLKERLEAQDKQLAAKDAQISDLGERLREAHAIAMQKQLEGPGHRRWWSALAFWRRT